MKIILILALLFCKTAFCQQNSNLVLINKDTCFLKKDFNWNHYQINVVKVSGIIKGRILVQTKTYRGKWDGFETIKEYTLADIWQQVFIIDLFCDRILIITEGISFATIHYYFSK